MSTFIQSRTYSGLHPVPLLNQARHQRASISSDLAVKFPALATQCSVSRSQDESDCCSSVNYGTSETQWMNGSYMDLRMRSNSLLNAEASHALQQHFHQEVKTDSHQDASEQNSNSIFHQIVSWHSSQHPSQAQFYSIPGLVVFDRTMLGQLGGSAFSEQYGHLLNGFNCGITSFMDEPFC